jgi:hypothetical protein
MSNFYILARDQYFFGNEIVRELEKLKLEENK